MPVNKSSSKRMMYQQNENPDIRQKLKLLSDSRGLKRQSMLKPSNVDRIEGISNGGIKRGGKTYHSRKYRMIPTLYGEGRKIKKMESDVLESDTESESEDDEPKRGRPKKLKGGMEAESDSSSDEELKSKSKRLNLKKKSDLEIKNLISRLEIFKDKNQSYVNLGGKWLPVDEQFLLDVIKEAKKRKIKISKKYEKLLGKRRTVKRGRPYGLTLDTMPYGEEEAEKRRRRRKNRARVVGEEREYFPEEEDEDEEEEEDEDDDSPAGARGMEEEDEPAGARGSFRPVRFGRGKLEITHYEGGAKLFGKSLMQELMKDPKFKLMGRGFFDKLLEGAKEFTRGVALPVKVAGKLIGNVVPPLKMAGQLVEGIDDPKWLKEIKGKGKKLKKYTQAEIKSVKGGKRGSPLQIENPNIRGSGFFSDLLQTDRQRIQKIGGPKLKGPILKNKGGKRKTSSWIDFVKKVAKEQNISYRDALKVASTMRR
jgi:hypothetical protein